MREEEENVAKYKIKNIIKFTNQTQREKNIRRANWRMHGIELGSQ